MDDLVVTSRVTIPAAELEITASRSSGPGGQHVNTADTRIQVRWNVPQSLVLSEFQRARLLNALAPRLTIPGDLILSCDTHRSQRRNRQEALQRLAALVRAALVPPRVRKKTRPTAASRQRRLEGKRRRARRKQDRRKVSDQD
ncbi:aminoacyl-tRNA hydrolase [bacterium]|nr:aminoacyl-tRNA hydrolase [bacterium]PJA74422.1 MAG: aminoacyl-tRNA hydrolase [bacterium CG_4_9_14_3_um_filter_65_15]